jgi:hypothetical protein
MRDEAHGFPHPGTLTRSDVATTNAQALCDAVFASGGARRRRSAAGLLITIFQVGRSVHIAADAIHTYATEIHPHYKQQVPADMLELIYFLDEDLGHWLLFVQYIYAVCTLYIIYMYIFVYIYIYIYITKM